LEIDGKDVMTSGNGDFHEIYVKFYPGILRFLTRMVGEVEAEDMAQEVFLKVSRGLQEFRGEASIKTWIYRVARNAALDRLRVRSQRVGNVGEIDTPVTDENHTDACADLPDDRASVERHLIGKEMSECIRGRVENLPESYRNVLVLSELAGMTNAEIASRLGTNEGIVKIRLHRARAMLRKDLGAHCALYRDERDELACEPKRL
jgi:RNA polymerase sigma-70 factor (ECF subfamily)